MKKIKVYRLENEKGIGPFTGGHRMEADYLKGHLSIRQCLVDKKGMKLRIFNKLSNAGWLCAWSSESDFDNWMNGKTEFFNELGYRKVTYETSDYRLCGEQKLFQYSEEIEDYISSFIDGFQVFFNPNCSFKKKI